MRHNPKHGITLSAAQQLKDLVLFCPKPYFRLVNNSKQYHKHKVHEKLIKLHIRHNPNGVTVKKIQAKHVTGTICQHKVAQFRATNKQAKGCKHAKKIYATKVYMVRMAWKKELCK